MASRGEDKQYGFDERRFEMKVSPNFVCSICLNVLKEPTMCGINEHVFCHDCIAPHLANFQTCPQCMQHLTPETLKPPPRLFLNCLSELKMYCIYNSRGCPAIVELGHLENHEGICEFAPVKCENKGCEMEVSKKDKDEHERFLCKFGKAVCHNCEDLRLKQNVLEKKLDEIIESQKKVNTKVDHIQETLTEMCGNQAVNQSNVKSLEVMSEQLDYIRNMMIDMFPHVMLRGANADVAMGAEQEIIIAGGYISPDDPTRSVEMSSLPNLTWSEIAPTNYPRGGAALCVRGDDIIITGGGPNFDITDTIEMVNKYQQPRRWIMLNAKLPGKMFGHRVVIYQGKLLVIGGYIRNQRKPSDAIYEVLLSPPYTISLLCRMPHARVYHRVGFMNSRLFIFGGSSTSLDEDVLDSVVVYDMEKNEIQQCLPLPYTVHHMTAVTWRSKIILLGGTDEAGNDLKDVTMYDTETQTSNRLPPMTYRRRGSSAVIFHGRIIVMGGRNKNDGYLSSAESLRINNDNWQSHEDLAKPRHVANAHGFLVPV